jgi:hypothetical protein
MVGQFLHGEGVRMFQIWTWFPEGMRSRFQVSVDRRLHFLTLSKAARLFANFSLCLRLYGARHTERPGRGVDAEKARLLRPRPWETYGIDFHLSVRNGITLSRNRWGST